jgi:predicted RNase H-like nuclease (RuvC/YqgF family)
MMTKLEKLISNITLQLVYLDSKVDKESQNNIKAIKKDLKKLSKRVDALYWYKNKNKELHMQIENQKQQILNYIKRPPYEGPRPWF